MQIFSLTPQNTYYPSHNLSHIIEEKTVVNLPTKNVPAKTTLKLIRYSEYR